MHARPGAWCSTALVTLRGRWGRRRALRTLGAGSLGGPARFRTRFQAQGTTEQPPPLATAAPDLRSCTTLVVTMCLSLMKPILSTHAGTDMGAGRANRGAAGAVPLGGGLPSCPQVPPACGLQPPGGACGEGRLGDGRCLWAPHTDVGAQASPVGSPRVHGVEYMGSSCCRVSTCIRHATWSSYRQPCALIHATGWPALPAAPSHSPNFFPGAVHAGQSFQATLHISVQDHGILQPQELRALSASDHYPLFTLQVGRGGHQGQGGPQILVAASAASAPAATSLCPSRPFPAQLWPLPCPASPRTGAVAPAGPGAAALSSDDEHGPEPHLI